MGEYKVGDCLFDKRMKKIVEIIEIIEFDDQDHAIIVKYFDTPYNMHKTTYVSKINKLFTKSKAARLLHKK